MSVRPESPAHPTPAAQPRAHYQRRFNAHPRARHFMPLAFVRFPFVKTHKPLSIVEAIWDCEDTSELLAQYRKVFRASDLPEAGAAILPDDQHLDNLYLHTLSFSLQLAGLTHHSFPIPLSRSLQTYMSCRLLQPIPTGTPLRFEARTGEASKRDKGVDFSFATRALLPARNNEAENAGTRVVWERSNLFYARRLRYDHAGTMEAPHCSVPDEATPLARWRLSGDLRMENARLLADFNPMHLTARLARLMGSSRASAHPPRIVRTCLAHLPGFRGDVPHQMEVWMKGPVFYHQEVELRAWVANPQAPQDNSILGLYLQGETRPALVIRLSKL